MGNMKQSTFFWGLTFIADCCFCLKEHLLSLNDYELFVLTNLCSLCLSGLVEKLQREKAELQRKVEGMERQSPQGRRLSGWRGAGNGADKVREGGGGRGRRWRGRVPKGGGYLGGGEQAMGLTR